MKSYPRYYIDKAYPFFITHIFMDEKTHKMVHHPTGTVFKTPLSPWSPDMVRFGCSEITKEEAVKRLKAAEPSDDLRELLESIKEGTLKVPPQNHRAVVRMRRQRRGL